MAERSSVFQGVQLGVETTPGTAVAANRKLQSLTIQPGIENESEMFRPLGNKFHTVGAQNREWTTGSIEGQPTYDELIYPLSSILDTATVTQPDATNAPSVYLWTFDPSSTSADAPKTFTVEQGDTTVRAHSFTHMLLNEFSIDLSREDISLGGSFIGQRLTDNITLTASPTTVPLVPVMPKQFDVYIDDTSAGLGTTKLNRAFTSNLSISNRYNPVWSLDSAENSWVTFVEGPDEDFTLEMMMEADAEGMAYLSDLRDSSTNFVRLEATGETIATTFPYRLTIDLATKMEDISEFSDEDGVYAVTWTHRVVHDSGWGRALKVELQNTQSAL